MGLDFSLCIVRTNFTLSPYSFPILRLSDSHFYFPGMPYIFTCIHTAMTRKLQHSAVIYWHIDSPYCCEFTYCWYSVCTEYSAFSANRQYLIYVQWMVFNYYSGLILSQQRLPIQHQRCLSQLRRWWMWTDGPSYLFIIYHPTIAVLYVLPSIIVKLFFTAKTRDMYLMIELFITSCLFCCIWQKHT